jgi:GNAT superfamily N-acetyltransferase
MTTIRRAVPADLNTVRGILLAAAEWLHRQGYDQWPEGSPSMTVEKLGGQISNGEFWLACEGRQPAGVMALSTEADLDFWTPSEAATPAFYISKLARSRAYDARGVGAMMLRWACDLASQRGSRLVRLDAWRTNADLHGYYRQRGWTYERTVAAPGRNSGTLFWRLAAPDREARSAFRVTSALNPQTSTLRPGDPAIAATGSGPVAVVCAGNFLADGQIQVARGGRIWQAGEVWPDPS